MQSFTTRWQNVATFKSSGPAAAAGQRLTFVLMRVVCGLQHGLVEVLNKGLCEPLSWSATSVLQRTQILLWRSNGVVEGVAFLGRLLEFWHFPMN